MKTTGIVVVAALAASADILPPVATITVTLASDKVGCQRQEPIALTVRPREFDCYVLIFDKTDFLEPRPEFSNLSRRNFRGSGGQESDDGCFCPLRVRGKRP